MGEPNSSWPGSLPGFPLVGLVWVDGGYVNRVDSRLVGWAREHENIEIVAVPRNADVKGFQVLPRRWVVERTFSWLGRCRRLAARDYERKTAHAEAMIKVAMIRLMAARLAGEVIAPRGPIETEAARRLADDLNTNEYCPVTQHFLRLPPPAAARRKLHQRGHE